MSSSLRQAAKWAVLCAATVTFAAFGESLDSLVTPAIPGYGAIHVLPEGPTKLPQNGMTKVVFGVTSASADRSQVNPALDRVANAINLYVAGGTALDRMKIVAFVYGEATNAVLSNEHYRAKFGTDNPNLKLIQELRAAGVDVVVSDQALAKQQFDSSWIVHDVTLAQSSLTFMSTLEQQGYAVMAL